MNIILITSAILMPYKPLRKGIVWKVAQNLIAKNGKTTTLEIKNQLRQKGYFATQEKVSKAMKKSDFDFVCKPNFRVYF